MTYREEPRLSQSELKLLAHSPNKFFEQRQKNAQRPRHFDIGTGVDIAVIKGLDALDDNMVIMPSRPTGQFYSAAQRLVEEDLEPIDENILHVRETLGINRLLKDETVLNKFEEVRWYYDLLANNKDKVLLTSEEHDIVVRIYHSLCTSKRTRRYFEIRDNVYRARHLHINYTYLGVECKAELDMVDFDMMNYTIQPYDVKTLGKATRTFSESVMKRRYDIQAASYTVALQELASGRAEAIGLNIDVSNFVILPFIFLVESTDPNLIGVAPMPFRASPELLRAGMYGVYKDRRYTVTGPGYNMLFNATPLIPGFHNLIEDYKWFLNRPTDDRNYTRLENEEMDREDVITLYGW